ncbi:MAG TPA: hypothetical protein VGQ05_15515, partial [Streptosporangiaceae bacterium]|nr:hypothetical protein [Streptosporangiaceae bacterium]
MPADSDGASAVGVVARESLAASFGAASLVRAGSSRPRVTRSAASAAHAARKGTDWPKITSSAVSAPGPLSVSSPSGPIGSRASSDPAGWPAVAWCPRPASRGSAADAGKLSTGTRQARKITRPPPAEASHVPSPGAAVSSGDACGVAVVP